MNTSMDTTHVLYLLCKLFMYVYSEVSMPRNEKKLVGYLYLSVPSCSAIPNGF